MLRQHDPPEGSGAQSLQSLEVVEAGRVLKINERSSFRTGLTGLITSLTGFKAWQVLAYLTGMKLALSGSKNSLDVLTCIEYDFKSFIKGKESFITFDINDKNI